MHHSHINYIDYFERGAVVPIRIDDPRQLLLQYEGKLPGASISVGFRSDGLVLHSAQTISKDVSGRSQQIVIPFDTPVKLQVTSWFFQVGDSSGQSLRDSNGIPMTRPGLALVPLTVPSGQKPDTIRLLVSGVAR